jgi:hypothetical protein
MAQPPSNEDCSTCRWWINVPIAGHPLPNSNFGFCRRWPPSAGPAESNEFSYPIVRQDFWCGEYKKAP